MKELSKPEGGSAFWWGEGIIRGLAEAEARGYAECQADVVAYGKMGEFKDENLALFLLSVIGGEHIGAAERASAHVWMKSNGWELCRGVWHRDDQEMSEEHTVEYWHEQVGAAERTKENK